MAPSQQANDVIGSLGGAVLAGCLTPQLLRLWRTRSAQDISYGYLALYAAGLTLSFVYLYFEHATVAWICMLVELGFVLVVAAAKAYLDNYGPYSAKVARLKSGLEEQQQQLEGVGGEQQLAGGGPGGPPCDLHDSQASGTSGNRGSLEAQKASEAERGTGRGGAQQRAVVAPGPQPSGGVRQRGQHP